MKIKLDIDNLIEWLKTKGLSRRTIQEYLSMIYTIDRENISEQYLLQWVYKHKHINYSRAALLNLFSFIKANKSIYDQEVLDLIRGFDFPQNTAHKKRRLPQILTIDQVFDLAFAMPDEEYKLMVIVTFHLALRREELITLRIDNFDWDGWLNDQTKHGIVRIYGKGNKQRNLPVPCEIMKALREFINVKLAKNPERTNLFKKGRRVWSDTLNKTALTVLNRKVNPHLLRHSCASHLREQGLDLKEIQEFLGHESIATTQLYTYVKPTELNRKVIEAFG